MPRQFAATNSRELVAVAVKRSNVILLLCHSDGVVHTKTLPAKSRGMGVGGKRGGGVDSNKRSA